MTDLISKGGPIMWFLLAASIFVLVVFIERLFHLHRAHIRTRDFLDGIYNVVKRNNLVEAISLCEETPGPVAHVVRAALLQYDEPVEEIARSIHAAGLVEIPRLERNLSILATMAKVTPLLGLVGTVLGMMKTLQQLFLNAPLAHSGDLAIGLQQALISTATGLSIAIFSYAAYNMLVSRVEGLVLDMEYASSDILFFLARRKRRSEEVRP